MDLKGIIQQYTSENKGITIKWDTSMDVFECQLVDLKTGKVLAWDHQTHDFVLDLVIDKIVFNTESQEYTKGKGTVYVEADEVWFSYISHNKFLRHSKPMQVSLDFEHPPEIAQNLNRSRLEFFLSINQKGFMRQDIKPIIDEGDAYTLGTHLLEKYRSFFHKTLQTHFDMIQKGHNAIDYELTFSNTVSSLRDKTFEKIVYWFELFTEENKVKL